jgi:hypothetical protein
MQSLVQIAIGGGGRQPGTGVGKPAVAN